MRDRLMGGAALTLLLTSAAAAQSYRVPQYISPQNAPAPRQYVIVQQHARAEPNLGGGFIEFLFGERSSGRSEAYVRQDAMPAQDYVAVRPETQYVAVQPREPYQPGRPAMDPRYLPQDVDYATEEPAGTVVVDTPNKFLYLVEGNGRAKRYGIGVGRPGFTWAGTHTVSAKKEWPDWRPPDEMLQRQPYLAKYMAGGPNNPLGARALYLGSTLYRIHGSNEPWTIGQNVSSGCIRMRNEDVTDLYDRVKVGAKVKVM